MGHMGRFHVFRFQQLPLVSASYSERPAPGLNSVSTATSEFLRLGVERFERPSFCLKLGSVPFLASITPHQRHRVSTQSG